MEITKENYQELLDKVYGGTVQPKERFINRHAVLLHYCDQCQREFYGKPLWLLQKDSQKHVCHHSYDQLLEVKKNTNPRKITDYQKEMMIRLYKQGLSYRKIALMTAVDHSTVRHHIKKAGL